MKYEYANLDVLKDNWDFIKLGLNRILRKSPEPWIPEDVYAKCVYKEGFLWLIRDDQDRLNGFFILEHLGEVCHIWCAWAIEPDMLDDGMKFIEQTARDTGAKRITFDTNRAGWIKVAKQLGFIPRTWVKELR